MRHDIEQHSALTSLSRIMLALLLSCALGLTGLRAQTNTEYSFRQQSVQDGLSYGETGGPGTGDAVPVLSMECLAANGYGQWTLSSTPGQGTNGAAAYPAGWYLLANGLYVPSTHYDPNNHDPNFYTNHPECIPPGVVQNGAFAAALPATVEAKVTTNLDGAVTYVWPDPNLGTGGTAREDFIVQGFRAPNIDLSLSFLSNPHTPMNIVGTPYAPNVAPTSFPNISTITGTGSHDVVTVAPYKDEYDVCSDAAYIYIAWCSTKHMSAGVGPSEIWWEILDVNTLAVVAGPTSAGSGMRPTISCDPRSNRGGAFTAKFDLAFIAPVNGSWLTTGGLTGGMLQWQHYNGGAWSSYPAGIYVLNPAGGANLTYYMATHARALTSSVLATGAWNPACYVIVEGFLGDVINPALILYNQADPNIPLGIAAYVDGDAMGAAGAPVPAPVPPQIGWPVKDGPIVAFANPYDNQNVSTDNPPNWRGYDQFHCLYQLDLSQAQAVPPSEYYPLLIVRNTDNGETNPIQPDPNGSTADTRLVLNQLSPIPINRELLESPTTYCAAVNQMGIHVHWRAPQVFNGPMTHYYARDCDVTTTGHYCGAFDEPIDENTLVTDSCTVTDGTWHGGTVGAIIINQLVNDNTTMAVWTDPNYGPPNNDATYGLFTPRTLSAIDPYVGTLLFEGTNVVLNVGENAASDNYPGGNLVSMPYCYFSFPNTNSSLRLNRGVTVNGLGNFDYYGLLTTHDVNGNPVDSSTPFTDGSATGAGGGTITLQNITLDNVSYPATLNVHGGANLNFGPRGLFVSNYSTANVKYEAAVYPPTTGTANAATSGLLTMLGKGTVDHSTLTANYPVYSGTAPTFLQQYMLHITYSTNPTYPSPFPQWISTNNQYTNGTSGGGAKIRIEGNPAGTDQTEKFDGDNFDGVVIYGYDMHSQMNINGCTFDNSIDPAIWLQESSTTADYGIQWITGNTFGKYTYLSTSASEAGQIEFDNFYKENFNWLQINGNYFTTNNGQNTGSVEDAINLNVSTATVSGNLITASKYDEGMEIDGYGKDELNPSLICSNTIKNSQYTAALVTIDYDGFVKLNELAQSELGYTHLGVGVSNVVFNNIHDNFTYGIDAGGDIDMSGVHHSFPDASPGDLPGYNTVKNNGQWPDRSQIIVETISETGGVLPPNLWLGQGSNLAGTQQANYTAYGDNNIEQGTGLSSVLIKGGSTPGANNIARSIDNNYWGGQTPPSTPPWNAFYYLTPVSVGTESHISDIVVDCGNDTLSGRAKGNDGKPLGQLSDSTMDSCDWAEAMAMNYSGGEKWQLAYDTIRYFFNHCYYRYNTNGDWSDIFGNIEHAILVEEPDSTLAMRSWLMSIRNVKATDPSWYCDVVAAIAGTYYENAFDVLAIYKFLIDNPHCPGAAVLYNREYNMGMQDTFTVWAGSDPHPNTDTFDSTLPSLHDLGLDSLLNDVASGVEPTASGTQIILGARVTANPFPSATGLSLSVSREAYVTIQVFDLLGRKVDGAGYAGVFEQGSREIPLDMSNAPPGAYYVRISTANDEVRTLKITKG